MSFRVLDSLIAITSKVLLVSLSKYSSFQNVYLGNKSLFGIEKVNLGQFSSVGFHQYQDFYSL